MLISVNDVRFKRTHQQTIFMENWFLFHEHSTSLSSSVTVRHCLTACLWPVLFSPAQIGLQPINLHNQQPGFLQCIHLIYNQHFMSMITRAELSLTPQLKWVQFNSQFAHFQWGWISLCGNLVWISAWWRVWSQYKDGDVTMAKLIYLIFLNMRETYEGDSVRA